MGKPRNTLSECLKSQANLKLGSWTASPIQYINVTSSQLCMKYFLEAVPIPL